MKGLDILQYAVGNIRRGGVKSVFCALALCVGICSVCTVSSLGDLALGMVGEELDQIGVGGIAFYSKDGSYSVNEAEVAEVGKIQGVDSVMHLTAVTGWATMKSEKNQVVICGVDEELERVFKISLVHGRLLTAREVSAGAAAVVIDDALAMKTYKRTNVVGKSITLSFGDAAASFEVVGVIRSQKQGVEGMLGMPLPNFIYVPYTAINEMAGTNKTKMLAIKAQGGWPEEAVAQAVARRLAAMSDTEFGYENMDLYTESFQRILSIVSLLAWGVAAISILVGGIGVMNSMVSAVEARTREIGILMSMGARKSDILKSFLAESLLICVIGGLCGAGFSVLLYRVALTTFGISGAVPVKTLLAGVAGAALCGVVFGLLPAWRAAGMNPIDAIREE